MTSEFYLAIIAIFVAAIDIIISCKDNNDENKK